MSAPDTNIERQETNHKPALLGIRGAMIFGALMLLLMVAFTMMRGQSPTPETMYGTQSGGESEGGVSGVIVDPVAPGTNSSN